MMSKRINSNQLAPSQEQLAKKSKLHDTDNTNRDVYRVTTANGENIYDQNTPVESVVQSVTEVTKRLSQVDSTLNISATSAKHRSRNTVGPWKLGKTLGKGSSGKVRLARNMETGQLAAIKIVPKRKKQQQSQQQSQTQLERGKSKMSVESSDISRSMASTVNSAKARVTGNDGELSTNLYGIEREIVIMKLISHPNIMGLYEVWENKTDLFLVLEYVDGGELFDYLVAKGRLSEEEAVHYFRQIIEGVAFCHSFNICHRDLKPENLLLDKRNKLIKIADFGMAALELPDKLLETSCGSPHYASPEIVMGKPYHGGPSDIWSCGIILYALLSGHLPFNDNNIRHLLMKVQSGKYQMPPNLSPEAKDLISKILVVNPEERIIISEILAHPLLAKYEERSQSNDFNDTLNPIEYITGAFSSIELHLNSREDIDNSVLSSLRILWHGAPREALISKLLQRDMCEEKLFYFLLLQYKQKDFTVAAKNSENAGLATVQEPQLQADTQVPPSLTYTGLSTRVDSSETTRTLTSERPTSDGTESTTVSSSTIASVGQPAITATITDSSQDNDPNAPILTQKSQFSISSLLKAHGIAISDSLSIRSQLALPQRHNQFVPSSSRTFKSTTSFKSNANSMSPKLPLPERAISTSTPNTTSLPPPPPSNLSLGLAAESSTDKIPLKMVVSKKSFQSSEQAPLLQQMPSEVDTKKSLYSLQSISKKSLNLNNFLSGSSTISDARVASLSPSAEQRGDFEMVCDQLLFGNTLDNILEEDENGLMDSGVDNDDHSSKENSEQAPAASNHSSVYSGEDPSKLHHLASSPESDSIQTYQMPVPAPPVIATSTSISNSPVGSVYSFSVDRKLAEMENAVYTRYLDDSKSGPSGITLKICTNPPPKASGSGNSTNNHPPSSPLPLPSTPYTTTQQGKQQIEERISQNTYYPNVGPLQKGSYHTRSVANKPVEHNQPIKPSVLSSGTHQHPTISKDRTLRMSSAPTTDVTPVPFSLDPRRNITEPSKLETLLHSVGRKGSIKKTKKTLYSYGSGGDEDEDNEWNFTGGSIFNALDQTLKRFREGLQLSYSQSGALLTIPEGTTGLDGDSTTGALAQSSDIQDPVMSRQPFMLSQATSFANLNRFVTAQEEETSTDITSPVPQETKISRSSLTRKGSFKRSPSQRNSLASFIGSKPRSTLISSKTNSDVNLALFSDLTYVLEIPTKTSTAEVIKLPHDDFRRQPTPSSPKLPLDRVLEEEEDESETPSQDEYVGDVDDASSFTSTSDKLSATSATDGVNIFEDVQSDTSSDLTDSDSNTHLQRKAISIDTLNTTNIIAPTTDVRISIYANDTNNGPNTLEKALPRETTEELIARFKLPENSMNRFLQKRFSKAEGNRLSEILHSSESTSSKFEDLQEEGEQEAVRISKIDVSASKHPLNNLQRTRIIEGQLRRATRMFESELPPDSVGNLVDIIDKMTLKEKLLVDSTNIGVNNRRSMGEPLVTSSSVVSLPKDSEKSQERSLPPIPLLEAKSLPEAETVNAPEESKSHEYDGEQERDDFGACQPTTAPLISSDVGDKIEDDTISNTIEKAGGKEVDSPAEADFEVSTSTAPKQPWYIKLLEGLRMSSKKHADEYTTKIPFDDLHLLTLNEFGKNNVDYRLKTLDRRPGKEKVEYNCRFVGGGPKFKLKISCKNDHSVVTIKRKNKLSKSTDDVFMKFNCDVERVIKELESK